MTEPDPPPESDDDYPATVRPAQWPQDLESVRRMFEEYRRWIADHQETDPAARERVKEGLALVDELIAGLPSAYRPPHGDILLWREGDAVVALGALRESEPGVGEIRRVFIRSDYRGGVFGRVFVQALVARARELRFSKVRADTLPTMRAAIEFYQESGFHRVGAFWPHPVAGAMFFERELDEPSVVPPRT